MLISKAKIVKASEVWGQDPQEPGGRNQFRSLVSAQHCLQLSAPATLWEGNYSDTCRDNPLWQLLWILINTDMPEQNIMEVSLESQGNALSIKLTMPGWHTKSESKMESVDTAEANRWVTITMWESIVVCALETMKNSRTISLPSPTVYHSYPQTVVQIKYQRGNFPISDRMALQLYQSDSQLWHPSPAIQHYGGTWRKTKLPRRWFAAAIPLDNRSQTITKQFYPNALQIYEISEQFQDKTVKQWIATQLGTFFV